MNNRKRFILNAVMKEIINQEETNGKLVVVELIQRNLEDIKKNEVEWAMNHLNEHCQIYSPKDGFYYRF